MTDRELALTIGALSREELKGRLTAAGIQLNPLAQTLLQHDCFEEREARTVVVAQRSVSELGLQTGGVQSQVLDAVQHQGFQLCPPELGPYLRLAMGEQEQAPDSVLSAGRIPTGALHIASAPLSEDDEYPKGFYLRVVDGVPWLRGFRCDGEYLWPPETQLAVCLPGTAV